MAQQKGYYGGIHNEASVHPARVVQNAMSYRSASFTNREFSFAGCTSRMMSAIPEHEVVNGKVTMAQRSHAHALAQRSHVHVLAQRSPAHPLARRSHVHALAQYITKHASRTECHVISQRFLHQRKELPLASCANHMMSLLPEHKFLNGKVTIALYINEASVEHNALLFPPA